MSTPEARHSGLIIPSWGIFVRACDRDEDEAPARAAPEICAGQRGRLVAGSAAFPGKSGSPRPPVRAAEPSASDAECGERKKAHQNIIICALLHI